MGECQDKTEKSILEWAVRSKSVTEDLSEEKEDLSQHMSGLHELAQLYLVHFDAICYEAMRVYTLKDEVKTSRENPGREP